MIKNIRTIGPVQANPTGWRTGRDRSTGANLSLVFAAIKVFQVLLFVVIYSSNCRLGCCSSAVAMWAPLENREGSQCRTPETERDLLLPPLASPGSFFLCFRSSASPCPLLSCLHCGFWSVSLGFWWFLQWPPGTWKISSFDEPLVFPLLFCACEASFNAATSLFESWQL